MTEAVTEAQSSTIGACEVQVVFPEFEAWDGPVGRVLARGRAVWGRLWGRGRKRGR